jgi:aminopeptidase
MAESKRGNESSRDLQLRQVAVSIIQTSLGATHGDHILLVFDRSGQDIADAFIDAAQDLDQPVSAVYVPVSIQGAGQNVAVWKTLKDLVQKSSAIITAVSDGQETTGFRVALLRMAMDHKLRAVHMPGVGEDVFLASALGVDFTSLHEDTKRVAAALTAANEATIQTHSSLTGTTHTLKLVLSGRKAHADGGIASPGETINIPTGEAYIAPIEDSADGSIVIDGSFPDADMSGGREVLIVFEKGVLNIDQCRFPDDGAGFYCRSLLASAIRRNPKVELGELGVGLNPAVSAVAGRTILDEKVFGTAHIAVGANVVFGGRNAEPYHIDLVFHPMEIILDGVGLDVRWRTR